MTETPLYNLTWSDYGTSLISAVQLLKCHDELVDVTLAAEGKTFQAHKVVLSAASPFLLDLFKSTKCKHPVIMLAGVQACDLEALLEFVYRGEVNVDPNQLPSLLQAAHCLNIQGLAPSVTSTNSTEKMESTFADNSKLTSANQMSSQSDQEEEDNIPLVKRRKRAKGSKKAVPAKWPSKVYLQLDPADNVTAEIADHQQEEVAQSWTHHLLSSTANLEALPLQQTPSSVQGLSATVSSNQNSMTSPKIRGASDQPGTCPLCGAMLRQARNLRRHLLTSCKYRMVNDCQQTTTVPSVSHRTPDLHHLQTISLQNLDRINPSSVEHLDGKESVTPISCTELLPSSSSNMSSDNL